jgi:multiple RNA-binding domain-containing protein 1
VWNDEALLEVGQTYKKSESDEDEDDDGDDNDDAKDAEEDAEEENDDENEENVARDTTVSDLDYLKSKKVTTTIETETIKPPKEAKNVDYFTVKLSGLPYKTTKRDLKDFLKPLKPKSIRIPVKIKGIAFVGFAEEKTGLKALQKHKSILSGHQVCVRRHQSRVAAQAKEEVTNKWREQEEQLKGEESVAESGRIFVRNLSYTVTEADIEELFKKFGPLTEVNVPIDKITRKIKGFAFVTFVMPENAMQAFNELDGTTFQGRLLHLLPAKGKPDDETAGGDDDGKMSFKKKKEMKEKAAAYSTHNWNTLFLGSSAVADLMAERYNVEKSDVVLESGGNKSAAVKLALGETQIVAETRRYLEEEGVTLDAFNQTPKARSKTTILVKNLPSRTSIEEIRDRFAKFGELGRVVLPPGCVTAIIEFLEPSEARKAFKGLAYTKFHNTPLYLEWAPENSFKSEFKKEEQHQGTLSSSAPEPVATSDDVGPEANATLFVKNLNFETSEEALRQHFESVGVGAVHSVTISRKRDAKVPGQLLSMGYGFVQFRTTAAADKALKTMQHKSLDGHCLELKRSNRASLATDAATARKTTAAANLEQKGDTTKMVVRNVPFEASEREVRELFSAFGTLKSVRLPKKVTGSHRGFAFVEFGTKAEAKACFDALCQSTHLYGRRLVLEWAEQEETIEDLRKKTAVQFADGAARAKKRPRKSEILESVKVAKKD